MNVVASSPERRLRVLQIVETMEVGGMERMIATLSRNLDRGLVKKCVNARQAAAFWVDEIAGTSMPST